MSDRTDNIEPVARALYAKQMRMLGVPDDEIAATFDRFWPVLAAQLQAGLIDEEGGPVAHSIEKGLEAWYAWLGEQKA